MSRRRAKLLLLTAAATLAVCCPAAAEPPVTQPTSAPTATAPAATQPVPATAPAGDPGTRATLPTGRGEKSGGTGLGTKNEGKDADDLKFADPGEMLLRMVASLAVLGVLAVAAYVVFKRVLPRVRRPGGRNVSVLETSYVGPRKAVHLLKVGRKRLLVASSRDSVSLLADVTDAVGGQEATGDAS